MSENRNEIKDYKTAFECFKQRFLIDKKSIFRLDGDDEILNQNSINYLIDNFVNNGYSGKESFIDKMSIQLIGKDTKKPKFDNKNEEQEIQKNAIEVLAHIIWLWRVVPINKKIETTKQSIKEILNLNDDLQKISLDYNPYLVDIGGFASVGTYYNTNKPFEIAFVINFLKNYLEDDKENIDFVEILVKLKSEVTIKDDSENGEVIESKEGSSTKKASIFNALLYLFKSEKYEPILSNGHKEKIVKIFEDLICKDEDNQFQPKIDCQIYCIKRNLNIDNFYQADIVKLWNSDSIEVSKNVIYYGVPGTGKTYGILKELQNQENIIYKFVQFHPSYGYEDFIEGIKPIKSDSKDIKLELINGEFKQICIEAFGELKKADEEKREAKKYYFIADEINRAELSRVFGELLVSLEEDKRIKIKDGKIDKNSLLIKTQYSTMWEDKHIVVKVDENLNINENGEGYFGVPENIYFIGTMNDVDKSIDSFDLALRRRFIWIKKEPNYKVIKDQYNEDYKKYCEKLNKKIAQIIGKNYQLGHSYFLKAIEINNNVPDVSKKILFYTELKPILEEYLRSVVDESEIDSKIEELRKVFIPEVTNDTTN